MTDDGYVPSRRPELFADAEADPYADEDLATYPDWWRATIEEWNEYGLRPFRPSRFADGALAVETVEALEAEFGVEIRLRAVNPEVGEAWQVLVDGEPVAEVGRHRDGDGGSVYELTADAFATLVAEAAD